MYSEIKFSDKMTLPLFSLLVTIGITVMFLLFMFIAFKKYKDNEKEVILVIQLLVSSLAVGYISSIFFDSLFKIRENGGLKIEGATFYGGLIGGIIAFIILLRIYRKRITIPTIEWLNILSYSIVAAHFFGRIGCFLGGCCYGEITSSWLGVIFPSGSPSAIDLGEGVKVYPTQLFEAFFLLIMFILLFRFIKKNQFAWYLVMYGFVRFIIEMFRGDYRGGLFGILSPAQFISIVLILIGAILLLKVKLDKITLKETEVYN